MIYGFMHIGTLNIWNQIFQSQCELLESTGLKSATESIWVSSAGGFVLHVIPRGYNLGVQNPCISDGENETIRFLHQKALELGPGHKIWYIHTKGARWKGGSEEYHASSTWRQYMEHFVVERWQDCLKYLSSYDACGVEWLSDRRIFSGNFWWANTNYLIRIQDPLPKLNLRYRLSERHQAEFYIGLANPKVKNMHTLGIGGNLYHKFIKKKDYTAISLL